MAKGPFDTKPEEFQLVKAVLGDKNPRKSKVSIGMVESVSTEGTSLVKSVKDLLDGPKGSVERLAFEISPRKNNAYGSLYMVKERLLPDELIKRISIQDDLVAAIANARAFHIASMGRPQPDRFSTGFKLEPEPGLLEKLDPEGKKKLQEQLANAEMRILTCGKTAGYTDEDVVLFSQFLWQTARQAVLHGRIAVEAIKNADGKFHSFRAIDVGTIYKSAPWSDDSQAEALRRSAINRIAKLKNTRLDPARFERGDYKWVQVIENQPEQAFTADECIVHNFYPVLDVELGGYPISPLDTVISAVTTHINITNHNKLYFENGRASRGMIIIKSDDADESTVQHVRQAFQASINNTKNAWRMPVFAVDQQSDVSWYPIDNSGRDMEFQYLSDSNARVILSSFQMSPEELPGYTHLCLHPDTIVWTKQNGAQTIGGILEAGENVPFEIWTGTEWQKAAAFKTGLRSVCKTTTRNGVTITTSPEHRFRVIGANGTPVWKQQKELVPGDVVLVNKNPVPGTAEALPSFNNRKLTEGMCEVLGWFTGDGSLSVRFAKGTKTKQYGLELYYHHDKEVEIRERHLGIMRDFGLDPLSSDKERSLEWVEKQKNRMGFHSVSAIKRTLNLYNAVFCRWMLETGFSPSSERKTIPQSIHSWPVEHRRAFLRGFFSADGSREKSGTPVITITDSVTREETKKLLLSLGIRTRYCEGTHATEFEKKDGAYRAVAKRKATCLKIKDKEVFDNTIGFLQPHKMLVENHSEERRWDRVPHSTSMWVAEQIYPGLKSGQRDSVRHRLVDCTGDRCRTVVEQVAKEAGFVLPSWFNEYFFEEIAVTERENTQVEMVDIEVFNDEHLFMANGMAVHNSRGTNSQALSESNSEYKLTAARDVGLRPLLAAFQDFVNYRLLPLIDEDLSKKASFKFVGLDAETVEKENIGLQQAMAVHMSINEVLNKVEKKPIPKTFGGEFLLNPQWQAVLDKYVPVGAIMEHFFGMEGASKDPRFDFLNNPLYFQQVNFLAQQQQMQMAQQAQQQQAAQQPGQPQQGQQPQQPQQGQQQEEDLSRSADQLSGLLHKSEIQLSAGKKKLLAQQQKLVSNAIRALEDESREVIKEILSTVEFSSKKK